MRIEIVVFIAGLIMLCLFQVPVIDHNDLSISYKSIFTTGEIDTPLFILYLLGWCVVSWLLYLAKKSMQLPE